VEQETCDIYLRKSDPNASYEEFNSQERVCREHAAKKGYLIHEVYREAHSGVHSPNSRKELKKAIDDVRHRRANVIIIAEFPRLARTPDQMYYVLFQVEKMYHGRIEAATGSIDRDSKSAGIQLLAASIAAQIEHENITTRTREGKMTRALNGKIQASPHPRYGYMWIDDIPGQRTKYKADPVSSLVVLQIFDRGARGESTHSITRELNRQGILPPSAYARTHRTLGRRAQATHWHQEMVRKILDDARYAGKPIAFQYKNTWEWSEKAGDEVSMRTLHDAPIPLPAETWPALVSEAQFEQVQQRLRTNRAGRRPKDVEAALLTGHVYCGGCGRKMYVMKKSGDAYAYCCSKRKTIATHPAEACPAGNHNMRASAVDAIGWDAVKFVLLHHDETMQLAVDKDETQVQDQLPVYVASMVGALRQAEERRKKLASSLGLVDEDSRNDVLEQMAAASAEIKRLEANALEAQGRLDAQNARNAERERHLAWIGEMLQEVWQGVDQGQPLDAEKWAEVAQAVDQLPYEKKRHAVELSPVRVWVYPVGCVIRGVEMPRTHVVFGPEVPLLMSGQPMVKLVRPEGMGETIESTQPSMGQPSAPV
jgi:DNA invertase Pin-like site-specific DNA recombinase